MMIATVVEAEVAERVRRLLAVKGARTVDSFHRELGHLMWEYCGMARNDAGLRYALGKVPGLRGEFWENVRILESGEEVNQSLEKAGRVADFFELAELMCIDALHREESCGGHFRVEYQTADGEAQRNDDKFLYAAAWEFTGIDSDPKLHKEPLEYEEVKLATRSYK